MPSRSERMRARWAQPEFRAKMIAASRAAAARPERRGQLVDLARANNARNAADPAVRARMSAGQRRRWADPDDPADRERMLAGAARGRVKIRQRACERETRRLADPGYARGRNPWLSAENKAAIAAAVIAGERRIMVAVDWLISRSRVDQIVREFRELNAPLRRH